VLGESVNAHAGPNVPNLGRTVEGAREDLVALSIKMQAHDLACVVLQGSVFLSGLHIPQLSRLIHGPSRQKNPLRIKLYTNNLKLMPGECMQELACFATPDLGSFVEGPSGDFIPVGVVKGHGVDHVLVALKGEELVAGFRVPDLTCSVITACNESIDFISRLSKHALTYLQTY